MKAKIDSIQWLRGLASMLVVFSHAHGHMEGVAERYSLSVAGDAAARFFQMGLCGVDIFFVISGFIMALITARMHQLPGAIRNFAQKRLLRIVPPYWLWTALLTALLAFLPQLFSVRQFNAGETLLSLLFIPYVPFGQNTSPVLAVGWTLSYEVYFYALVCLGLLASRTAFILGLGLFFLGSTLLLPAQGPISGLLSSPLLWEFYAGIVLYEVTSRMPQLRVRTACALACLALVLLYAASGHGGQWRFLFWGIPAVLLTGSLVLMREVPQTRLTRLGVFLGDSSYTLYLSHLVTLPAVAKVFILLGLHTVLPPLVQIVAWAICCTILGGLLYLATEKPLLHFLNKKFPVPRPDDGRVQIAPTP